MAEVVVVGLFAAVFKHQRFGGLGMAQIAEQSAHIEVAGVSTGEATAFGMGQGHVSLERGLRRRALPVSTVEARGRDLANLPGAEAGGKDEADAVGGRPGGRGEGGICKIERRRAG